MSIAILTGEGGILSKAKTAGISQEEQEAREKLELVLQDLTISKHTDSKEHIHQENRWIWKLEFDRVEGPC